MSSDKPTPTQVSGQQSQPTSPVPYTPGLVYSSSRDNTNNMAVISLAAGILSFFANIPLPGIGGGTIALIAIVTGFIARGEIKRTGEKGSTMAVVGIVLGIVHFTLIALIFVLLILGIFVFGAWALLHH